MSLARETGRGEKASMFHDMRESFYVTWLCTFRKGMGSQRRVDRLKAERVRGSLLVIMQAPSHPGLDATRKGPSGHVVVQSQHNLNSRPLQQRLE